MEASTFLLALCNGLQYNFRLLWTQQGSSLDKLKKSPFSFINFCFPLSFRILGNYDSGVRTSEICNSNILPLFLGNMLSSVPQPQDLSCGLMHGTLYIPLSSGPGASQVRVIPWLSTLHGSQLLPDEAKILHSQQHSL